MTEEMNEGGERKVVGLEKVHGSASLPPMGLEWRRLILHVQISYAAQNQSLAPLLDFMQCDYFWRLSKMSHVTCHMSACLISLNNLPIFCLFYSGVENTTLIPPGHIIHII